jgi:hypothetical protein
MPLRLALLTLLAAAAAGSCQARDLLQAAPAAEEAPLMTRVGVWRNNVFPLFYQSDGGEYTGVPGFTCQLCTLVSLPAYRQD